MFKKLLTVLMSIVMSATLFAGCTLIATDREAIDAQQVAVIDPISFYREGESEPYFTSERYVITRKDLKDFFIANNGAQYLGQGVSAQEILEAWAPAMLSQQMILLEGRRMFEAGEMKTYRVLDARDGEFKDRPYTQAQDNETWQSVYKVLDGEIFTLMTEAAKDYGFDPPAKIEDGDADPTPPWPVRDPETEDGEEYAEPWTPVSVYTSENDVKLHVHAARQLLGNLIDELTANPRLLTESDRARLDEDRARYDALKGKPINDPDVVALYANLRTYHCVEMKYYQDYYDNMMYDSIESTVMGRFVTQSEFDKLADGKSEEEIQRLEETYTVITPNDVTAAFATLMQTQKNKYTSESAYLAAVKADTDTIVYRPYDVQYYYVKHILIPFSDEQKAAFATGAPDMQGLPATDKTVRAREAAKIRSYAHVNGFDAGPALSVDQIRADILQSMSGAGGSLFAANRAFDDLMYKYNTDPGIFSKTRGYPMRYDENAEYADSPNGMVEEFEEASATAYAAYLESPGTQYGRIYECVSDHGIHFVMVSDVLETSPVEANINDYTSAAETQTYYEKLEAELLSARQKDYFSNYASSLQKALQTKYEDKIHLYDSVYADLAEELTSQYTK